MVLDLKGKNGFIGLSYDWNGLKIIIKERNFRIHLIATLLVIGAGLYFNLNVIEWAIVILIIGIVLITEMFNSVIEQTIDQDRKSTRLNSSHVAISYAVFCLKK